MAIDQARANRIFLPGTYAEGVPYGLFRELRAEAPVCWVEEPEVGPWPAGPGYWAVLRHADVKHVLRTPELFSSQLGATQVRDPDTAADLDFARAMMLNQDPLDHSRLRHAVAAAAHPERPRQLRLRSALLRRRAARPDPDGGAAPPDRRRLAGAGVGAGPASSAAGLELPERAEGAAPPPLTGRVRPRDGPCDGRSRAPGGGY